MNWQKMVRDLMAHGLTQVQIGERLGGLSQSWVADIAKGRYVDLKWHDGQALLALHMQVCKPKPADQVLPVPAD